MLHKFGKTLCLIIVTSVMIHMPASACQTFDQHRYVFFNTMSALTDDIDTKTEFVGEITLNVKTKWLFIKQDKSDGFTAYVHKSPTHPELEGKRINVFPINETSCGPWVDDGDRGFVSATIMAAQSDEAPLLIRLKSRRKGLLSLPSQ